MSESRYFRLTEKGKRLFGLKESMNGRRMHWGQVPLDLFNDPDFLQLPDSQKLPFIGVGLLCVRRANSVLHSVVALRRSLNLRVKPDLALYMDQGLIEFDSTSQQSHSLDKSREEEKRVEEKRTDSTPRTAAAVVPEIVVPVERPWTDPPRDAVAVVAVPWSRDAADDWREFMGGEPMEGSFAALKRLLKKHPWPEIRSRWRAFLSEQDPKYVNQGLGSKFAATYESWTGQARASPAARARVDQAKRTVFGGVKRDQRSLGEGDGANGFEPQGSGPSPGDGGREGEGVPGGVGPPERR